MFFVGHIPVAFLITYFIASKRPNLKKTTSIALVMFLSTLPDIDIIIRLAGIDLGHRTFTHSPIIWTIIGGTIITFLFFFGDGNKKRRTSVAALTTIYVVLSHLVIGDVLLGPINIIYPFGKFVLPSPIMAYSLMHVILEFISFALMATILTLNYSSRTKRIINSGTPETSIGVDYSTIHTFRYHRRLDGLFYPILLLAISISLTFLSDEFGFGLLLSSEKIIGEVPLLVLILHLAVISLIGIIWFVSKKSVSNTKMRITRAN